MAVLMNRSDCSGSSGLGFAREDLWVFMFRSAG
jgi:hypothetical protein